jgi:hypothetical protein
MTNTFANNITIIHEGDGHQFIALGPDVCKTPSPGGPIPVPYPNIALSSDLAEGSKTVKVERYPSALKSSNLKTSSGDEGGTAGGGIVSSKIKGKLKWMRYSTDVKFEGKGVVRFLDDNMHNGNAGNIVGKNKGKMTYPGGAGDINCDNCGKPISDPSHKQLRTSSDSDRVAKNEADRGHVGAGVVMKCGGKTVKSVGRINGDNRSRLNPNSFTNLAKNFKSGKAIPPKGPRDRNPSGHCAEQKALYDAFAGGGYPPPDGCEINLSVLNKRTDGNYVRMPSCPTCRRVLTSMMCTNDPN